MNKSMPPLFVTGTDTNIGKTVLSLLLMKFFYRQGATPFYLKPLQTGCRDPYDTDSDARFVYRHVDALKNRDPADSVIYCFKTPKAPWFAARDESKTIDPEFIATIADKNRRSFSPLIIEGAGGLLVPVTESCRTSELIQRIHARPVIAARAGLGTINHTLLTIEHLSNHGIEPVGIVFIDAEKQPTPPAMLRENIEAVEHFSGIKVSGIIHRIEDFSNIEPAVLTIFENMFS